MSDEEPNEIVAAARAAKARKARADKRKGVPLGAIGLGIGIGSAAVAAAVLYANRDKSRRDDD